MQFEKVVKNIVCANDVAERAIKLVQVNREVDQISFVNISENYLATKLCACPPLKNPNFSTFLKLILFSSRYKMQTKLV